MFKAVLTSIGPGGLHWISFVGPRSLAPVLYCNLVSNRLAPTGL